MEGHHRLANAPCAVACVIVLVATATSLSARAADDGVEPDDPTELLGDDDDRPRYPHPASVPMVIPDFEQPQTAPGPSRVLPERHRWIWHNLTVGRLNPEGAGNRFSTGYRLQLWDRPGLLFERSFAALKLVTDLTPAFGKIGGRIELQPLAILNLAAQYELVGGFGASNFIRSYDKLGTDYSDTALDETKDAHYAGIGEATTLSALLQFKVSSIALRNDFKAYHQRMDLESGESVFLNLTLDALHPNGGWAISNDVDLLLLSDFGLKLGARYTLTHAFYPEGLREQLDDTERSPTHHRLGPAILYTFVEEPPGAPYAELTAALLSQWWIDHRYRTGQDSAAGFPYLLLAIIQRGDFMP